VGGYREPKQTTTPRFREGLSARGERENSGLKTPFLTVKTTGETPGATGGLSASAFLMGGSVRAFQR